MDFSLHDFPDCQNIFVFYSYTDAIPDFEAAIKLDGTIACFHVCLGLTYLLHSKQYQK